jgi:hypothetical protein
MTREWLRQHGGIVCVFSVGLLLMLLALIV